MFKIKKILAHRQVLLLIRLLAKFFAKLPHLPNKIIKFLIRITPWFAIILGILALIATLSSLLFSTIAAIAFDWQFMWKNLLISIITGFTSFLLLQSFKPLKETNAVGWIYLFWVHLINVIFTITEGLAGTINPFLAIINILLFSYLLFEIGPHYTYIEEAPENKVNE